MIIFLPLGILAVCSTMGKKRVKSGSIPLVNQSGRQNFKEVCDASTSTLDGREHKLINVPSPSVPSVSLTLGDGDTASEHSDFQSKNAELLNKNVGNVKGVDGGIEKKTR